MAFDPLSSGWNGSAEDYTLPINQQDSGSKGLMEIVTLRESLALNVQGRRSKFEYMRAFKATTKLINMAGGYAGEIIVTAKLVAKETSLKYETLDGV